MQGREKLQDAFYIYQEMIDKYGGSSLLLVAQSACLVLQQKYEQADAVLQVGIWKECFKRVLGCTVIHFGRIRLKIRTKIACH